MHLLTDDLDKISLPSQLAHQESILTVGAFDGIHLGHQHLVGQLVAQAHQENRLAGLVTFYPHPAAILSARSAPMYLTTPGEKAILLEALNLDWTAILPFTLQLAATSSREFVHHLYRRLNMRGLWISQDFALGRDREGDAANLTALGQEMGFYVRTIPPVSNGENKISSSHIRTLLRHGHVEQVTRLLGRHYRVSGEVVHGAQRGRCLGFPTANVAVSPERVIPANGIYATLAYLGSEQYQSVTNVGTRPSFDNGERSIEAHLLDFNQDIYGCDLVLEFVARLRPEERFSNVQDLIAQISRDVVRAQEILNAHRFNAKKEPGPAGGR